MKNIFAITISALIIAMGAWYHNPLGAFLGFTLLITEVVA
jgi:hypothetical protein